MRHRHPTIWLMTDARIGDLSEAIVRLPRGSGIVFRHFELETAARRKLFTQVSRTARRGRHTLLLADTPLRAWQWGADGAFDVSSQASRGLRAMAVHDGRELVAAERMAADLIFVSPVFPTRSHPGAKTLGILGLIALTSNGGADAIALGGMNARQFKRLRRLNLHGWAAIDAFRT